MPRFNTRPTSKRHRNGQAALTLRGHRVYIGPFGSALASRTESILIAKWQRQGYPDNADGLIDRLLRDAKREARRELRMLDPGDDPSTMDTGPDVLEVVVAFVDDRIHGPNPVGPSSAPLYRAVETAVREHPAFAQTLADDLELSDLERWREAIAEDGTRTRGTVNRYIGKVKEAFAWGRARGLVAEDVAARAAMLRPLTKHAPAASRCRTPRSRRVVSDADIEAVCDRLTPTKADMVRLLRAIGCRPCELCELRGRELDRSESPWLFRPGTSKVAHHGIALAYGIDPKARALIERYLTDDPSAPLFTTDREQRARWEARARTGRGTLATNHRRDTSRRLAGDRRVTRTTFTAERITRAIASAIREINRERNRRGETPMEWWTAYDLRHTKITAMERAFGIAEASMAIGHRTVDMTRNYTHSAAERARLLAAQAV